MSAHPLPMTTPQEDVVDLAALMRTLWRGKVWIGVMAAVFMLAGVVYAQFIATPKYRATTVLLLDTTGQKIVDLGGGAAQSGVGFTRHQHRGRSAEKPRAVAACCRGRKPGERPGV